MRILAIDYGQRRVGIATTDPTGVIASPLKVIDRKAGSWYPELLELFRELAVTTVVVGLPRNMDGTLGRQAQYCQEFAETLKKDTTLKVELVDERLTTAAAASALRESGNRNHQTKARLDAVAASLILQTYLGQQRTKQAGQQS
jgi:putative holliday junction resolvase